MGNVIIMLLWRSVSFVTPRNDFYIRISFLVSFLTTETTTF